MIPAVAGLSGVSLTHGALTQAALSGGTGAGATTSSLAGAGTLAETPGVGGVGEAGASATAPSTALEGPAGSGEGFGGALSEAISSLEKTQQASDSASQALATGTVKDPASAVVTVEDAQLAMQLASQIRTKATEAAQSIFQTQV